MTSRRLALVLLAGVVSAACTQQGREDPTPTSQPPPPTASEPAPPAKVKVVVNVWALKSLVQEVGGELVEVDLAEHELHAAPTPDELEVMDAADVVLYVGNLSQEVADKLKAKTEQDHERYVDLSKVESIKFVPAPAELGDDALPDGRDPHVWLAPDRVKDIAFTINRAVQKKIRLAQWADAPKHTGELNDRTNAVVVKLGEAHDKAKDQLKGCAGKTLVAEHPAYGYLASAMGLVQLPVTGISSEELPPDVAARKEAELANRWAKENNRTIFLEHSKGPQGADPDPERQRIDRLADKLGAVYSYLSSLEDDPKDLLAREDHGYFEALAHDVAEIKKGLKC